MQSTEGNGDAEGSSIKSQNRSRKTRTPKKTSASPLSAKKRSAKNKPGDLAPATSPSFLGKKPQTKYRLDQEIENTKVARDQRKTLFQVCLIGACVFFILLLIETGCNYVWLFRYASSPGERLISLEVMMAITTIAGIFLSWACVRISSQNAADSTIPPVGPWQVVMVLVNALLRNK